MFDHSRFLAQKYSPHILRSDALVTRSKYKPCMVLVREELPSEVIAK